MLHQFRAVKPTSGRLRPVPNKASIMICVLAIGRKMFGRLYISDDNIRVVQAGQVGLKIIGAFLSQFNYTHHYLSRLCRTAGVQWPGRRHRCCPCRKKYERAGQEMVLLHPLETTCGGSFHQIDGVIGLLRMV